jgi:hypothetical protein
VVPRRGRRPQGLVGLGVAGAGRDQQVERRVLGQDGLLEALEATLGSIPSSSTRTLRAAR